MEILKLFKVEVNGQSSWAGAALGIWWEWRMETQSWEESGGTGAVAHPWEAKSSHPMHKHALLLHFQLYSSIGMAANPSVTSGICHPLWKGRIRLSRGAEGISSGACMENRRSWFPALSSGYSIISHSLAPHIEENNPNFTCLVDIKSISQ